MASIERRIFCRVFEEISDILEELEGRHGEEETQLAPTSRQQSNTPVWDNGTKSAQRGGGGLWRRDRQSQKYKNFRVVDEFDTEKVRGDYYESESSTVQTRSSIGGLFGRKANTYKTRSGGLFSRGGRKNDDRLHPDDLLDVGIQTLTAMKGGGSGVRQLRRGLRKVANKI